MTTPKLNEDEYSDIVDRHNRMVRGGGVPRCIGHEYARVPWDSEKHPELVCVHCLNRYVPDMEKLKRLGMKDPRKVQLPRRGKGAI